MPATILADNAYFARLLRGARRSAKLKRYDAAKLFGIEQKQLARYECGKQLIPAYILEKLFYYGFVLLNTRKNTIKRR